MIVANYLLSYEAAAAEFMQPQLQSFIKQHKLIAQWSQPYAGLYLLKSDADLPTLVQSFDEFFARRILHIICPISIESVGGILPGYLWHWLTIPVSPGSGIQGLLQQYEQQSKDS